MVSIHVEPTSRCTLACPRCERTILQTEFGKKALTITDLNIADFTNFVDIRLDKINFCGNLGDPIYHPDFLQLVETSKKLASSISITTNGSRKSRSWWQKLNNILDSKDNITFSIDGTPENFTEYRVNGDWESVLSGIQETVNGPASTEWQFIPFKFNEKDIEQAHKLSAELGIDKFVLRPSDRWTENDALKPDLYIGDNYLSKLMYKADDTDSLSIDPKCANDSEHFISAEGSYMPCCYSKHYKFYYKTDWWKNREKHAINKSSLSKQISYFQDFYVTIHDTRPDYCMFNCGKC